MKFLMALLVPALLVISACRSQSRQAGDQSGVSAEEYAVYAAVIGDMFAGDKVTFDTQAKVNILVIEDRTVSNTIEENEGERLKQVGFSSISQETIGDYVAKNGKSHQLTKSLDLKLKYVLIPKEESDLSNLVGSIALSRVGFDSSGNQALVYIRDYCGPLCGGGNYLLLVKNRQGWIVKKRVNSWVS